MYFKVTSELERAALSPSTTIHLSKVSTNMYKDRVVDSNQFCLNPNPGLSVHSDPNLDPAQDTNTYST
jgi:hypothetical protein